MKTETREENKNTVHRKKLPRWGKILLAVVVVVAVVAGAGSLYVNGKLDLLRYDDGSVSEMGTIDASEDQDLDATGLVHNDEEMEMPEGSPFADEDVLNILLIGTDERTEAVNDADAFTHLNQLDGTEDTTEFSDDARADAMILVSLNIKEHTIRLVSIERATGVPILLDGYEGQYDWITHTFRYGGAKLTMDTVEDCFNVQVDHYVRVNFNSFVQIVDAVGGVDIDITELEAKALNWEVPSNSMLIVNKVEPGLNHFDGYTALQYARLRKIDSDWKRIERQRTVIQAVLDQVKNASVVELDNLLNTVLPLVQTNFTKSEITALLVQLPGFLGADVEQLSMPLQGTYGVRTGMDDRLMYDPDWAVNIKALQDFLYNDQSAEEVIAATPETASAEEEDREDADAESEAQSAWERETDPAEEYIRANLHTVDLAYPLSDLDFGDSEYRLYLAGLGGSRDTDAQQSLIEYLSGQGTQVVAVQGGVAAGVLLDNYLQTGDTTVLTRYLATLPAEQRAENRALWQTVYEETPRRLHAVGLGDDKTTTAVGSAVTVLMEQSPNTPDEELRTALDGMTSGNPRTAVYWFCKAMEQNPTQMEEYLEDAYATAQRLYQGLQGTDITGTDLIAQDLEQALERYPDGSILAFVEGAQALQSGDTLATRMEQLLEEEQAANNAEEENPEEASYSEDTDRTDAEAEQAEEETPRLVCSIAVLYGKWGNNTAFTPTTEDGVWSADGLSSWLGDYVTPGKDLLLVLDGEDCPCDSGDAAMLQDGSAVTKAAQKLLILDPDNKIYEATPENAEEGEAS